MRYYLTALLLLSHMMPTIRYWSPTSGVGKYTKPIEVAPYRLSSSHPLSMVMLARLSLLFRDDQHSPFMTVLALETLVRAVRVCVCVCV